MLASPIILLLASVAVCFGILSPRLWLGVAVHVMIFGPFLARIYLPFDYADEGVVVVTVLAAFGHCAKQRRIVKFPGMGYFLAFGALGVLSAVQLDVPASVSTTGAFLALKSVLFGWAVAQLPIVYDRSFFSKLFRSLVVITAVGAFTNLVIPGPWFELFSVGGGSYRGGIASPVGFMVHPGHLAQFCVLLALALYAAFVHSQHRRAIAPWVFILLVAIAVLTLRRKALIALVVGIAVYSLKSGNSRSTQVIWLSICTGLLLFAVGPDLLLAFRSTTFEYFGSLSNHPRVALYQGAFAVSSEHFPFGSGFGRYGTAVASSNYSPEYLRLGFPSIWGLEPGGAYGQDAFWPGVLGEAGWPGAICYLLGLGAVLRSSWRASMGASGALLTIIGAVSIGWWVEFAVESIAAPVYLAAPLGPVFFALCAVLARLNYDQLSGRDIARVINDPSVGARM